MRHAGSFSSGLGTASRFVVAAARASCGGARLNDSIPEPTLGATSAAEQAIRPLARRWLLASPVERHALERDLGAVADRFRGDPLVRYVDVLRAWDALERGQRDRATALARPLLDGPNGTVRDLAALVLGATERRYLAEILWGFLRRDYIRVAQVHFDAGYVPAHHSVAAFAQALRAVGEPVFGRVANAVAMSRVLTQLFEITALYEMRLRPELVLLQKPMMTVEGVARRIDPEHDIWAAAEPVVKRWIARELSPITRIKQFAGEADAAIRNIARMAAPVAVEQTPPTSQRPLAWFAMGAAMAGAVFLLAALVL